MFIRSILAAATCSCALCFSLQLQPLSAQNNASSDEGITIVVDVKANPTLQIGAISGDAQMAAQVKSDLKNCGWFDIVSSGADYQVTGTASRSGGITLKLEKLKGGSGSIRFTQPVSRTASETAHKSVDLILQKLFNIKNLCNSKILFSRETSRGVKEICMCDFDGSNEVRITRHNTIATEPEWGPQGSVLYTVYHQQGTYVAQTNLRTGLSRRLSQFRGMNSSPALSPNQSDYACLLSKDGAVELYLRSVSSTKAVRLTRGKGAEASPAFSPDGSQICFVSDEKRFGRPGLYTISAGGGTAKALRVTGSDPTSPDWSNDNKLVYSAKTAKGQSICVTDLSGKAKNGVGEILSGGLESPSWAPDNRHVVCQRTNGRTTELWVIDTWTRNMRKLIKTQGNVSTPNWEKR